MKKYLKYIGTKYKDGGRTLKDGLDCWGLVRMVMFDRVGINLPSYSYDNDDRESLNTLIFSERENEWIKVDKPEEGDVVFFYQLGQVSHVGYMIDSKTFIHASKDSGVVAQELSNSRWRNRVEGFYRHEGLTKVRVIVSKSLINPEMDELSFDDRVTIKHIIENSPASKWPDLAHVTVQGNPVRPEFYDSVIRRGAVVNIRLIPKKDSGALNAILGIAVLAWSAGSGGAFFSSLLGVSSTIGTGIAGIIGMLIVNAIAPLPDQDLLGSTSGTDQSNIYSISGPRNRLNPMGAVPIVFGRHKHTPPYATKPYTSIEGDDTYLHCMFLLGFGPLDVQSPKLGDTDLGDYPDVEWEIQDGSSAYVASELFPSNIDEEQLSITLNYDDGYSSRRSSTVTYEISVDYLFPQGLCVVNDDGTLGKRRISINAQYKGSSSGTYLPFLGSYLNTPKIDSIGSNYTNGIYDLVFAGGGGSGAAGKLYISQGGFRRIEYTSYGNGYTSAPTITVDYTGPGSGGSISATITEGYVFEGETRKPFRHNFRKVLPSQGEYDFRTARTSAEDDSDKADQYVDTVAWTTFRSVSYDEVLNINYNVALFIMKIRATDSLNGQIENFNCVCTTVGKGWDTGTGTWVDDQLLLYPGELYRYTLQGPFKPTPVIDSLIDLDNLGDWVDFCRQSDTGFKFSYILDTRRPVGEILDMIAAAGRASRDSRDLHGVIIDRPQTYAKQLFTGKNSFNLSKSRTFFKTPDCIRVNFVDEDSNWQQQTRLVYADGKDESNSTIFTNISLPGVTSAEQVWKLARYHLFCSIARQKQIKISADFEWVGCKKGELVDVSNDLILSGISQGRLASVSGLVVTVRENCPMELGGSYSIEIRDRDTGRPYTYPVVTVPGDNYTLTIDDTLVVPIYKEDMFAFGVTGDTSLPCLTQNIIPGANDSAQFALVPYDEDVYTAGAGTAPTWNPQYTLPDRLKQPNPPRRLEVDEYLYSESGMVVQGVNVRWVPPENTIVNSYELQILKPSYSQWETIYNELNPSFDVKNAEAGIYSFRVRARRGLIVSTWLELLDETVESLSTPAPDVQNLRILTTAGKATLAWDPVVEIRPVIYEIRNGTGSWFSASVIARTSNTFYQPTLRGTYQVKAVANAGYSVNAASLSIEGDLVPGNAVQDISEGDDRNWDGTFVDCSPVIPLAFDIDYFPSEGTKPDSQGWTLDLGDSGVTVDSVAELIEFSNPSAFARTYTYTSPINDDISVCLKFSFMNNGLSDDGFWVRILHSIPGAVSNYDQQALNLYLSTGTDPSYIDVDFSSDDIDLGILNTGVPTDVEVIMIRGRCWVYIDDELKADTDLIVANSPVLEKTYVRFGVNGTTSTDDIYFGSVEFQHGSPQGVMLSGEISRTGGTYTTNEANILDVGTDRKVSVVSPFLVSEVESLNDEDAIGEIIPEIRIRKDGRNREYSIKEELTPYEISVAKVYCDTSGYLIDFDIVYTEDDLSGLGSTSLISENFDDIGINWITAVEVRNEEWTSAGWKSYDLDTAIPSTRTAWGIRSYKEDGTPTIYEVAGHTDSSLGRVDVDKTSSSTTKAWVTTNTGGWTSPNEPWKAFSPSSGNFWETFTPVSGSAQVLNSFPSPRMADSIELSVETTLPGSEPEDYTIDTFDEGSWVNIATVTGDTWSSGTRIFSFTRKVVRGVRITVTKTINPTSNLAIRLLNILDGTTPAIPTDIDSASFDPQSVNAWWSVQTSGFRPGYYIFNYSTVTYWDYAADSKDVSLWKPWAPIVSGEYLARWFDLRLRGLFLDDNSRINVYTWDRILDMEDLIQPKTVSVPSGGTSFTFDTPYQITPDLTYGILSGATGDTVDISSLTTTGFTATIYDSSKVTKAGTLSYIASGY